MPVHTDKRGSDDARMLPDVDTDDGDVRGEDGILVLGGDDLDLAIRLVVGLREARMTGQGEGNDTFEDQRWTHDPSPSRSLNGSGLGVDLLFQSVDTTEITFD